MKPKKAIDRVAALCDWDSAMLQDFNSRSIQRLKNRHRGFRTAMPLFNGFKDANVQKEVKKDRIIIEHAAARYDDASDVREIDADKIFEMTKSVDRAFLETLALPALSPSLDYARIKPIRMERIRTLAGAVDRILGRWEDSMALEEATKNAYSRRELRGVIKDILRLYTEETRSLAQAIKLPPFMGLAVRSLAQSLYEAMEETCGELADEYAGRIFSSRQASR
jgi:hypothetical protein